MRPSAAQSGGAARYISVMSEHLGEEPLPAAPSSRLIERKIALDGVTQEFPLERWLVTDELIVGRWLSDGAPPFEGSAGFTSWGVWWPGRPYGGYRIHRPDGSLRLYRFDALEAVRCDGEVIEYHDLLLDALIRPGQEANIEDEDEVAEAVAAHRLSIDQRWRIAWVRGMFERQPGLLCDRMDAAIDQAVAAVRAETFPSPHAAGF